MCYPTVSQNIIQSLLYKFVLFAIISILFFILSYYNFNFKSINFSSTEWCQTHFKNKHITIICNIAMGACKNKQDFNCSWLFSVANKIWQQLISSAITLYWYIECPFEETTLLCFETKKLIERNLGVSQTNFYFCRWAHWGLDSWTLLPDAVSFFHLKHESEITSLFFHLLGWIIRFHACESRKETSKAQAVLSSHQSTLLLTSPFQE